MKNSKLKLEIVVSVILFFLIVSKVQLITFINPSSLFQSLYIIIFFFSAVLGIVGMFLQRHWGYAATYFLILISSIALGIASIPFITSLFSINASTFLVILTSLILFLITAYLHLSFSKSVNKKIN